MNSRRVTSSLSCIIVALMASSALAQATAEVAPAADKEDGDIVVTARGRNETLQSAPASITAFSAQALADARVKGVSDFIALTPGISITQSQSAGISFVTIRGIGQVRNGESSIAVVKDGVQQITSRQFTSDLFDVEQIEVLRGPQGALYGRNAIGGAMVIRSQQPTNDFHFAAQASYGNGEDKRIQAAVSGPLVADTLLFRVSGSYRDFDGLFHNAFLNVTEDRLKDANVRGHLKAILSDTLTIDARASYTDTKVDGYLFQYQGSNFDLAQPCFLDPMNPFGGPLPDANRYSSRICSTNRGENDRSIFDASLRIEKAMDWGTISNTAAFVHVKEYVASDQFPFTASRNIFFTDGTQTQYETLKAFQNEIRITSNDNARFKWMVGAYYLRTKRFISTSTGVDNDLGIVGVYREPQYLNPVNPTLSFLADDNLNRTYAAFASIGYEITPELAVSAAYRYDHDSRVNRLMPPHRKVQQGSAQVHDQLSPVGSCHPLCRLCHRFPVGPVQPGRLSRGGELTRRVRSGES
jgi:iron complex outermembrane recepter protein